ncbi:tRNA pseudouridine(13) synthase TruD [Thalassotalea marina]|uniref:tRNA pseudouridine synthase D n=1 Tax=Thalassotalea marina TaxID=1673741 RepID=A0A919BE88_9GAMM|nr:tRNA pseudouridine(13) synthase TruD [Thalassotalea marina]GHF85823.1 tRNA pseudouridine synthase D [Thalassotalea marina]
MSLPEFSYLFGQPNSTGDLRSSCADFKVFEQLPFEPSGEGEHLYIYLRKTGQNTQFVARALAKHFNVKDNCVSYAGLKDRHAVTEQWFGVHMPGGKNDDLTNLDVDGVEVLKAIRHNKKLKTGALTGNQFEITLRNCTDLTALQQRWHLVSHHGVPNYFGEQRFGIQGNNLVQARAMFDGKKIRDKNKRSMYLSAARSLIFNHMISERIDNSCFEVIQIGDVLMLSGSQSVFKVEQQDDSLTTRLQEGDLDITAPMWGKGNLLTFESVAQMEQRVAHNHQELCQGLDKFGLKQERRRIRLLPSNTSMTVDENDHSVVLSFFLPAGSFATSILREVVKYTDLTNQPTEQP